VTTCVVACDKCHARKTVPVLQGYVAPTMVYQCPNCVRLGIAPPGTLTFTIS